MLFKVFAVAGWVTLCAVSVASAQSMAGPAENPPPGFKGSQYVDSRGCVFLRAGIGGRVSWVPRVSRNRKALCGTSPAAAAREVAKSEPAPTTRRATSATPKPTPTARVTPPKAERVGRPMKTIANLPATAPVPRVLRAPAPQPKAIAAPPPKTAPKTPQRSAQLQNGCPASSPYGARVTLTDGRPTLICSADAGFDVRAAAERGQVARRATRATVPVTRPVATNDGYTPKVATAANGYRCPPSAPIAKRYQLQGGGTTVMCTAAGGGTATATPPLALGAVDELQVPKGYRKAWDDDRLNPNRGIGTVRGQTQQDQIWTRDVPARLVAAAPTKQAAKRKAHSTSTSNAPKTAPASTGRYFVQVGTFGEPANAQRSAARLQAMGLPVASSRITSKGRKLQIVMAGPFRDTGSAQAALSKARRSGFGDAFIR